MASAGSDRADISASIGALKNTDVSTGINGVVGAYGKLGTPTFSDTGNSQANAAYEQLANAYQAALQANAGGSSAQGILQDQLINGGGNRAQIADAIQKQASATGQSQNAAAQGFGTAKSQQVMNDLHANMLQTQMQHNALMQQYAGQNASNQAANDISALTNQRDTGAAEAQNNLQALNEGNSMNQFNDATQVVRGVASGVGTAASTLAGMSGSQSGVSPVSSGEASLSTPQLSLSQDLQSDSTLNPSGLSTAQISALSQPLSLGNAGASSAYTYNVPNLSLTSL